ncbi:MAG: CoA transferase [Proteobacteria bacterium]|nr:CoA transferase [Pseudomonadota bacterium]
MIPHARLPIKPAHSARFKPLAGARVLSVALNLPGPMALARLRAFGAEVHKIEPPAGDPMRSMCAPLYRAMHQGVVVHALDLKSASGQAGLQALLRPSDLLITSFRPAALARLGMGARHLARAYPRLSVISIVGQGGHRAHVPGHDLTYQAQANLLDGARLPATLLADMTGALLTVEAAMGAVLHSRHDGRGVRLQVALADAAAYAAVPRHAGLTSPGGLLGGALPNYAVYACRDGLVAIAALEPHFAAALAEAAGGSTHKAIARWCKAHNASELQAVAMARDLPLDAWVHAAP